MLPSAAPPPTLATPRARVAGVFYLANIGTIFLAIFLFRGFASSGGAAATAANVTAHLGRYRFAFASQVISTATSIVVAALLYGVFKPVDSGASLTATLFRVLACGLAAVGYVLQLAPVVIMSKQNSGLAPAELQALAQAVAAFQIHVRNVSIAFFGCQFLVLSYLIARSAFLPRFLVPVLAIGGVGGLAFAASPAPPQLLLYFARRARVRALLRRLACLQGSRSTPLECSAGTPSIALAEPIMERPVLPQGAVRFRDADSRYRPLIGPAPQSQRVAVLNVDSVVEPVCSFHLRGSAI